MCTKMGKFFCKMWQRIKCLFKKKEWLPDENLPANPDNIRKGEIGGYFLYDKTKATIDKTFVENVRAMGIDFLYFNTQRKTAPLSYEEWYNIFELFKDSSVKIRLYCYEAVSLSPKWTTEQIKSINNHPAFHGWIAEDEVTYAKYDSSLAWIKKFHNQMLADGDRKFPNLSITYLPKLSSLKADAIGENYSEYLDKWSDAADEVYADMYPIIADQSEGKHYIIEEDGVPVYSKSAGGEKWFDYLAEHLEFTKRHPELTHRLYIQTCKHISKDNKGKQYISYPKPTLETIKIQAYASLMSGSDGLMLFLLKDCNNTFFEAAFDENFKPTDTYYLLQSFLTSKKFLNFKELIGKLDIKEIDKFSDGLWLGICEDKDYWYHVLFNSNLHENLSLAWSIDKILNLENNTANLESGEILVVKRRKE